MTKQKLKQLLHDGNIEERESDRFFEAVRAFYETAYNYCQRWLPLNDDLLKNCQFINFEERLKCNFDNVTSIIGAMPNIFGKYSNDVQLLDQLQEEFLTYQGTAKTEIPQNVWDNAAIRQGQTTIDYRMDIVWNYLKEPLPLLSKVALTILTIPHSNAAEEFFLW